MTATELLAQGFARLRQAGIEDPARDTRRLLAYALGTSPDRLAAVLLDDVSQSDGTRFDAAIAARCRHQPVAQIIGQRSFWGRVFKVTPDVLDPRPETETLVAEALNGPCARVLDLGTGSGCILLSILAERPLAEGVGTDLSEDALQVARANAAACGVADRVTFQQSDWLSDVTGTYDLVVSNPPYISAAEMQGLNDDVRNWEPHLALSPGGDGLDAYRAILARARRHLTATGRILLEIGPTQAESVKKIAAQHGFTKGKVIKDLDERDRVVIFATQS